MSNDKLANNPNGTANASFSGAVAWISALVNVE